MTEDNKPQFIVPTELPPHAIAFIIDGVVEDVIHTSDRFAALTLSEPTIAYATGVHFVVGETTYDPATKIFTNPDGTTETAEEFVVKKKF
jgi:hypothetical protein